MTDIALDVHSSLSHPKEIKQNSKFKTQRDEQHVPSQETTNFNGSQASDHASHTQSGSQGIAPPHSQANGGIGKDREVTPFKSRNQKKRSQQADPVLVPVPQNAEQIAASTPSRVDQSVHTRSGQGQNIREETMRKPVRGQGRGQIGKLGGLYADSANINTDLSQPPITPPGFKPRANFHHPSHNRQDVAEPMALLKLPMPVTSTPAQQANHMMTMRLHQNSDAQLDRNTDNRDDIRAAAKQDSRTDYRADSNSNIRQPSSRRNQDSSRRYQDTDQRYQDANESNSTTIAAPPGFPASARRRQDTDFNSQQRHSTAGSEAANRRPQPFVPSHEGYSAEMSSYDNRGVSQLNSAWQKRHEGSNSVERQSHQKGRQMPKSNDGVSPRPIQARHSLPSSISNNIVSFRPESSFHPSTGKNPSLNSDEQPLEVPPGFANMIPQPRQKGSPQTQKEIPQIQNGLPQQDSSNQDGPRDSHTSQQTQLPSSSELSKTNSKTKPLKAAKRQKSRGPSQTKLGPEAQQEKDSENTEHLVIEDKTALPQNARTEDTAGSSLVQQSSMATRMEEVSQNGMEAHPSTHQSMREEGIAPTGPLLTIHLLADEFFILSGFGLLRIRPPDKVRCHVSVLPLCWRVMEFGLHMKVLAFIWRFWQHNYSASQLFGIET